MTDPTPPVMTDPSPPVRERPLTRRDVLKAGAVAVPCVLGAGGIFAWLSSIPDAPSAPIDPIVAAYDASAHRWAFVVDTNVCIGCGRCVLACKQENGVPYEAEHNRTWVERHTTAADGTVYVDSPEAGAFGFAEAPPPIDPALVVDSRFVSRLCMQCEESPCTVVCPVGATYRTEDGVTLVDEERCIGCGYCIVACPYGARYIVPAGWRTPTGVAGVVDKCTFCYHRITRGQQPACVDICPVGSRKFGDLNDPSSEVSVIIAGTPTTTMRPELGTLPRVHYVGLEGEAG